MTAAKCTASGRARTAIAAPSRNAIDGAESGRASYAASALETGAVEPDLFLGAAHLETGDRDEAERVFDALQHNGHGRIDALLSAALPQPDDSPATGERAHPGGNWADQGITLTADQPTYWSALTGQPANGGLLPFTALDPEGRDWLLGVIDELRSQGATVMMATHLPQVARQISDQALILDAGKVMFRGAVGDLPAELAFE